MKEFVIAFILALVATSWVYTTGGPPQSVEVGVKDIQESEKRKSYEASDSTFDNFELVDGSRNLTIMDHVTDKGSKLGTHQSLTTMGADH